MEAPPARAWVPVTVSMPGELPGARMEPATWVSPPMVPEPLRVEPLSTARVAAVVMPVVLKVSAATVSSPE